MKFGVRGVETPEPMTNAVDMRKLEGKGDFSTTTAADLLSALEGAGATVRIWLETEIGVGQVEMHQGKIVTAEVGPLRKRSALLRILNLSEGNFSVSEVDVRAAPPIVQTVSAAVQVIADRQQEWLKLCESSPSMSSVLRLSSAGRAAKRESIGAERIVYSLVDGRRTIMDILSDSELDPIDALRAVVRGMASGYFEDLDNSASLLPLPVQDVSDEAVKIPLAPMVPRFQSVGASSGRPSELARVRKGTLVGLGVDLNDWEPLSRKATESLQASPIIDLGIESPDSRPWATRVQAYQEHGLSVSEQSVISEPADSLLGNAQPIREGATQDAPAANRHVGRYEVIHRIGRGGMGSVYLARLTARGGFRRLFALKLLRSYLARDSAAAEAFLAEARLAGQLHHPNVVGVVDAGVHDEQPYLVMDYVEGCSLKQLMTAHPDSRPPRLIVPIMLGALDGLSAVHNLRGDDGLPLNVVHCDVSPENLLVGADGICRLTDFGVARRAQLTGATNIHGKPAYVAPEQVSGGPIDARADIFALGVVLWSVLTGERLFLGDSVEETLHRVCTQPVAPPSTVGLRPPSEFDAVCLKALERDLSRRHASAEDMQADLREAAMRVGLIGLNSEVASWVRRTVGQQLSQRRLLVLEASRPSELHSVPPGQASATEQQPDQGSAFTSSAPPSVRYSEIGDDPNGRTMPLQRVEAGRRAKQVALVSAAILAIAMVLVAILWPAALTRLFKMESQSEVDPAGTRGLSVGIPASPNRVPPSAGVQPSVTPVPNPVGSVATPPVKTKEQ